MSRLTGQFGIMGLVIVVLGMVGPAGASARSGPTVSASLASRSIDSSSVGRFHCHDFSFPRIQCFRTRSALEAAVESWVKASDPRRPGARLGLNYVRVFQHVSYAGASAYLAVDYPDLRTIGWNDIISSYYVVNSGSGWFFQNIGYGGIGTSFCCNQGVTNVGPALNDTFSAVQGSA